MVEPGDFRMDLMKMFELIWMSAVVCTTGTLIWLLNSLYARSSKYDTKLSRELKSLMLGLCVTDIVPLSVLGLLPIFVCYNGNFNPDTVPDCADVRIPQWYVNTPIVLLISLLLWFRHSFVLNTAYSVTRTGNQGSCTPPGTPIDVNGDRGVRPDENVNGTGLKEGRSKSHRIFHRLVAGPPMYVLCCVGGLTCLAMIVDGKETGSSLTLCLEPGNQLILTPPVIISAVLLIHILWWFNATMTKNNMQKIYQGCDHLESQTPILSSLKSSEIPNCEKVATGPLPHDGHASPRKSLLHHNVSIVELFLSSAAIWLPAVQCTMICLLPTLRPIDIYSILFMVWLYTIIPAFSSVCLILITLKCSPEDSGDMSTCDEVHHSVELTAVKEKIPL